MSTVQERALPPRVESPAPKPQPSRGLSHRLLPNQTQLVAPEAEASRAKRRARSLALCLTGVDDSSTPSHLTDITPVAAP